MFKIHVIGIKDDKTCSSMDTKKQIKNMKNFELDLSEENKKVTWNDIDNPEEPRTILQAIIKDRELRVDKRKLMADRPPFAVFTTQWNRIIRLEFYEGHDALKKVYDIRNEHFQKINMSDYLEKDPQAYDPVEFLYKTFGLRKEFTEPLLKKIHQEEEKKKK